MGLFGSEKAKSVTGSSRVIGFLDEADDTYMLAFDSRNIKPFAPYTGPVACIAVLWGILPEEDRYFGIPKLRGKSRETVPDNGRTVCAIKHVGHEAISCGHGLSVPLGD